MIFTNSSVLKSYVKKVNKLIKCDKKIKKSFIDTLCESITEFSYEHPEFTLKDLYNKFGTPEEISERFMFNLDDGTVAKYEKKKFLKQCFLFILRSVLAALVICLILGLIYMVIEPPIIIAVTYFS